MTHPDFSAVRRESLVRYLAKQTSAEIRFDDPSRLLYATDASHYQILPLGVVIPRTPDDLVATVQIACELGIPITPRGGGTSLTGQSIGPGIVIDCSKYLNAIREIDPVARTVRVQPGAVLEQLNKALAPHNLLFGPDVATANRATIGGMIGNNSAGARSIVYRQTVDHVNALHTILSDGTTTRFAPFTAPELEQKRKLTNREGEIYRTIPDLIRQHAAEIDRRFPQIVRKVSGYNLAAMVRDQPNSLVPLLVGSEGTLAVVADTELALVPRPAHRGLLVPHFDSLASALGALAVCLELHPSAVELMDRMLIELARNQRGLNRTMQAIQGRPAALLMVEFASDSETEIADQVEKLSHRLKELPGVTATVPALDPALRDPLWNLRSAAVPLLYGMPGDRKPVTFVEDCAVAPEHLPEFALQFQEIIRQHGTEGAFYGHASVGCLHIRPVLNLHDSADVRTMRAIMEDVTNLVLRFNGSLSGEHGDGLVRSEWNRKMFGETVYGVFRQVKRAFDPNNVFNPGKIVDAPAMEENWRWPPDLPVPEPATEFDYGKSGGFFRSIELCNGAGVCRKTQGGAMCPSYRATRDERDSTRGRANALRHALAHAETTATTQPAFAERWLKPVMDLCLSCKACKSECPSNVDLAKLKAEWQQAYYAGRTRPLGHRAVKNIHRLSPWAARFARLSNWMQRQPLARRLMQAFAGIDRRRSLPHWHREHFRRWFTQHLQPTQGRRVILLDDCFTTFQEPQIGQAAVELLESAGCRVELANFCCGRAMLSKGYVVEARELAKQAIPRLAAAVQDGTPVLGLEPSCLLTLVDEWPELVPGPAAQQVAGAAHLVETWLLQQPGLGFMNPRTSRILYHGHCHQRALVGVQGTTAALQQIPGARVTALDAGCCGMAGAFGYEAEHFDLSVQIANLELIPSLTREPDATVVASGTSCRHQIRDLTGRVALHPVELLAAAVKQQPVETAKSGSDL